MGQMGEQGNTYILADTQNNTEDQTQKILVEMKHIVLVCPYVSSQQ